MGLFIMMAAPLLPIAAGMQKLIEILCYSSSGADNAALEEPGELDDEQQEDDDDMDEALEAVDDQNATMVSAFDHQEMKKTNDGGAQGYWNAEIAELTDKLQQLQRKLGTTAPGPAKEALRKEISDLDDLIDTKSTQLRKLPAPSTVSDQPKSETKDTNEGGAQGYWNAEIAELTDKLQQLQRKLRTTAPGPA